MRKIIGIAGLAGSGKDTMYELLHNINPKIKRFALADALKTEIRNYVKNSFQIDILSCSREQKDLVRPLLVAHGKVRRIQTKGTYWTSYLEISIRDYLNQDPENIALITDIRYAEYEEDEHVWIKKIGGCLVHLNLILPDGKSLAPINLEEASNDPILRELADYKVTWEKTTPFSLNNEKLISQAKKIYGFMCE